jgi:vancomycin resistance protein VanW
MRKFVPKSLKLTYRALVNARSNRRNGYSFAKAGGGQFEVGARHTKTQGLQSNVQKRNNLKLAGSKINLMVIAPGEVLSFWRTVGNPTARRGYQPSRSILGNEVVDDVGGGLCQLSGLMYQCALECGVEVVERHAHSKDIYTEETRYMPLGSDATVAFGYKDFKLRNNLEGAIRYQIVVDEDSIQVALEHEGLLPTKTVEYERVEDSPRRRTVHTKVDGERVAVSSYNV